MTEKMLEIPEYVWDYAKDSPIREKAAIDLELFLSNTARNISVSPHGISARAKSLESFYNKATKQNDDGSPKYTNPKNEIHDCIAARVILYTESDKEALSQELENSLNIIEGPFNPGLSKNNGYDSIHIITNGINEDLEIKDDSPKRYPDLFIYFSKHPALEIQLRTVASHAWAEYEHDVRYKSKAYEDLSEQNKRLIDQLFIEAGGLRRYIDATFNKIQDTLNGFDSSGLDLESVPHDSLDADEPINEISDTPLSLDTLKDFIMHEYKEALTPDIHVLQNILSQLEKLQVFSTSDIKHHLSNIDQKMTDRYMDYNSEVTSSRRLDDDLLAAFGEKYIESEVDEERRRVLKLRFRKIQGKIAIYQVAVEGEKITNLTPATKALRSIVKFLATSTDIPLSEMLIDDVIEFDLINFSNNARPVAIKAPEEPIYIRTNLNRGWSEDSMEELALIAKNHNINITVTKSGDQIIPSIKYS